MNNLIRSMLSTVYTDRLHTPRGRQTEYSISLDQSLVSDGQCLRLHESCKRKSRDAAGCPKYRRLLKLRVKSVYAPRGR